jgi:uncharacterized coiled-coil protein SlyX
MRERRKEDVIVKAIKAGFKDLTKWMAIQNQTIQEGLAAIALAASTPDDNSAEIKALTEKLKSSTDALAKAVADNQPTD